MEVEYAITVKYVESKCKPNKAMYDLWVDNARDNGFKINQLWYEWDSYDRLHIHGVALAKPNFWFKSVKMQGFSQCIERLVTVKDHDNWVNYCKKDQPPADPSPSPSASDIPEDFIVRERPKKILTKREKESRRLDRLKTENLQKEVSKYF